MKKLCVNCRFHELVFIEKNELTAGRREHMCTRDELFDPVTGDAQPADCYDERKGSLASGACGKEGRFWRQDTSQP